MATLRGDCVGAMGTVHGKDPGWEGAFRSGEYQSSRPALPLVPEISDHGFAKIHGRICPERGKIVIPDDVQMRGFKLDDLQLFQGPKAKSASLLGKDIGRVRVKWSGPDKVSYWTWARFTCSRGAAHWEEVKMSLFTDSFRWIYEGKELRGRWHSTLEYERIRRTVEWLSGSIGYGRVGDAWFGSTFDSREIIAKRYGLKNVRTIDRDREQVRKMLRVFSEKQIKVIENYIREELALEMRARGEWPKYPQDLRTYPQRAEEAPERKDIARLFEVHIETVDQWFEKIEGRVLNLEAQGEYTAPAPFYFGVEVEP